MWYYFDMSHKDSSEIMYQGELQIGERGRLVLPAQIRRQLSLRPGDRLVVELDTSGEIHLASLKAQVTRCRGMFKVLVRQGKRLSDELIEDRRREALEMEKE
jgi:AbrB family looped-hinge helix DNA binding protein